MNILLAITSSIAAKLDRKLFDTLSNAGHEVRVIYSNGSTYFSSNPIESAYTDSDEKLYWESNKQILHIDLAKWADVYCVAPASANIIGKFANGLVDNLVSSVYAAIPAHKRNNIVIAPAMNTEMYFSPAIQRNLKQLQQDGCNIVDPQVKTLMCGDTGIGALAEINEILASCDNSKNYFAFIPPKTHPGSYGFQRKHEIHTGVDLYVHRSNANVFPFEPGIVVDLGQFTGASIDMPHWNDTSAIYIKSNDKVVCYGEIELNKKLRLGDEVCTNTRLGTIIPVTNNRHPEHKYHNNKMLHVELFEADKFQSLLHYTWSNQFPPYGILDPTPYLQQFIQNKI